MILSPEHRKVTGAYQEGHTMLQQGHFYTFHMKSHPAGEVSYLGRFISYDDDRQGRPTMFTIERRDRTRTTLLAENILAIDYGDTLSSATPDRHGLPAI
jgi:hypothetical protein